MQKRTIDVAVVSDVHLGTFASKAKQFSAYLQSIDPKILILNGDIIDGWQFSRRYFPTHHIMAIKEILNLLSNGTKVIYITGNHDEALRKYADLELGNFLLTDKIALEINGNKTWIFHGDVFDRTTEQQARFWGKLGSNGYALLLAFNRFAQSIARLFGKKNYSLSEQVMKQFNNRFVKIEAYENKIAAIAIDKKYDTVICGHIHKPEKRMISTERGTVCYLNSGDWMEHSTALEYYDNEWHLFEYKEAEEPANQPMPHVARSSVNVITEELLVYFSSK